VRTFGFISFRYFRIFAFRFHLASIQWIGTIFEVVTSAYNPVGGTAVQYVTSANLLGYQIPWIPPGKVVVMAVTNEVFDPHEYLTKGGFGKTILQVRKNEGIFSQGEPGDTVFYIHKGKVKLTVVSPSGKEATIAILGAGNFVGEECITSDQPLRTCSSKALTPCTMLRIRRQEMVRTLTEQPAMSRVFIKYLLSRNTRIQADLVDQLFNSSEKRLARTLLMLSQTGREDMPLAPLPKISQATLADMVGTTRSRVSFFMNRFRKLGFIEYSGLNRIHVNSSLLSMVPLQ
jgi:CRP-like cAMP-binding protein